MIINDFHAKKQNIFLFEPLMNLTGFNYCRSSS